MEPTLLRSTLGNTRAFRVEPDSRESERVGSSRLTRRAESNWKQRRFSATLGPAWRSDLCRLHLAGPLSIYFQFQECSCRENSASVRCGKAIDPTELVTRRARRSIAAVRTYWPPPRSLSRPICAVSASCRSRRRPRWDAEPGLAEVTAIENLESMLYVFDDDLCGL
jgi:hypothetical protein